MAQLITGDSDTFNALAFGETHPGTQQFLSNQMEAPSSALNDYGRQFFEQTQALYHRLEQSNPARLIKAAKRAIGSIWQNNEIRYLSTIGEMQWAPLAMQRYIMAEPTVRQMYHEQRLEGYDGTYKDAYPEDIGESHYHYRRVMNGIVDFNEGDDEPEWSATTYYDDLEEEDNELDLLEQDDILLSWQNVLDAIQRGNEDPTSRWAADL